MWSAKMLYIFSSMFSCHHKVHNITHVFDRLTTEGRRCTRGFAELCGELCSPRCQRSLTEWRAKLANALASLHICDIGYLAKPKVLRGLAEVHLLQDIVSQPQTKVSCVQAIYDCLTSQRALLFEDFRCIQDNASLGCAKKRIRG